MIPTDWIGNLQLSLFLAAALGAASFAAFWRLGVGEDLRQIGFWAEPSVSPVSVGALLLAEDFERIVDELLEFESVFVDWIVEGLVQNKGAFIMGLDVVADGESRSIASVDVPMMLICSTSDDAGSVVLG